MVLGVDMVVIVQSVVILLIFSGIAGVFKVLRDIRGELRVLNGRLGRMEVKIVDHEELDNTRFAAILRDITRLESQ